MKELDVRGLSCPLPLVRTKRALDDAPAEIIVLADSGTAKANVTSLLADEGYAVTVDESDAEYRIRGVRG